MADDKHSTRPFDFEINSYADVEEHLDRLWEISNMLCDHAQLACSCGDPPGCCNIHQQQNEDD